MESDYTIEDIYQGGYSSLNPSYGELFTGQRVSAGSLGLSGDPRTANILKDFSDKIGPGIKTFEFSLINPEIMETIPKQHLKEVNRLSKLTGVDVTVHGPLIDASGVGERGFNDQEREIAERKIAYALDKSHEINPNGNVPVTFHTANALPAARYSKKDGKEITEMIPIVNQETGQISVVRREEKYYPHKEGKEIRTVEQEVDTLNNSEWLNNLTNLESFKLNADELMQKAMIPLAPILAEKKDISEIKLNYEQAAAYNQLQKAGIFLENVEASFNSIYNKAYKYSKDPGRKVLGEIAKDWRKENENMRKEIAQIGTPIGESQLLIRKSQLLDNVILKIRRHLPPPEVYKSAGEYASEKSQETFGNAAWSAYKKFGEKAPILSIENPPAGMALSRADDVRIMVEGSRKQFVNNAVKGGMSKSQAEKQAEKLIGVTWDVGHINELRQFGFTGEDILKEAEKIAPLVKHIHLADNFGMHTTVEMPMGMGNVDIKGVMEKLGKKGKEAKKIIEAGNWWQHHSNQGAFSPVGPTLEALGSSIYSMHMSPYWNQVAGTQQGYFSGYGAMLPPVNYETFGAGFSNLPAELGGQRPGGRGRMSGTPME